MCGIAGYFQPGRKLFDQEDLHNMTTALAHRGPDAEGFYSDEIAGLGHRRLSIIDLSSAANQPMHSTEGRYQLIFNGEIYNYRELASRYNLSLKTNSDTEVILELFIKLGIKCVNELNGMFAFVLYDSQSKTMYMARDRSGIKPLFYYKNGNEIAFASELNALLKSNEVKKTLRINFEAIRYFLHLDFIPEPATGFENIYKFPAGHYAELCENKFEVIPYWKAEDFISNQVMTDEKLAKEKLKDILENAVKGQMISDVPFGTFLSGGIDSSLVTAIAQKHSSSPVKTFSIGFKDSDKNEAGFARQVSEYLGTNHHEFFFSEKDAVDMIENIFSVYTEPFADTSALPTMLVSKMARQHVTMTLSGDGGDELFMGYGTHIWANRLSKPLVHAFRKPIGKTLSLLGDRYKRASHLFDTYEYTHQESHVYSQEQYSFSAREIQKMFKSETDFKPILFQHNNEKRKLSAQEKQALFELKYYLRDDLLVKVDRASMQYSLETRVPLLDHNLIEFSLNLSPDLKIKQNVQKYLLKQVLFDYVPAKYFNRPKWGFSIPLQKWMQSELSYLIEDHLLNPSATIREHVDTEMIEEMVRNFRNGEVYLFKRIWLLIIASRFIEKFKS